MKAEGKNDINAKLTEQKSGSESKHAFSKERPSDDNNFSACLFICVRSS